MYRRRASPRAVIGQGAILIEGVARILRVRGGALGRPEGMPGWVPTSRSDLVDHPAI